MPPFLPISFSKSRIKTWICSDRSYFSSISEYIQILPLNFCCFCCHNTSNKTTAR
nr:MAG TPA: hypothetical protein [Caudoviricetes sp.]